MAEKKNIRYQRKWSRAVCLLAIWAILLIPIGIMAKGTSVSYTHLTLPTIRLV